MSSESELWRYKAIRRRLSTRLLEAKYHSRKCISRCAGPGRREGCICSGHDDGKSQVRFLSRHVTSLDVTRRG
ncbi:hypothetical protein CPB85DRAFT_1339181 [Mucidula mucida]|nr:hypothetical protein CPB85DRAFT_1339583 [Mucidula mucida]KAF8882780.1 hypothetical protein CPB85DRAFT_1339181 [Mucidula mucida]